MVSNVFDYLELMVLHCNAGLLIWLIRGRLEHYFSLLYTSGQSKKLPQAVEKLSIWDCISCSMKALRAQSSAKRKSLTTLSVTFETALSRLRLRSFPLGQNLTGVTETDSLKASDSMAENIMLKIVGASTQPCLTLLVMRKSSEPSPSSSGHHPVSSAGLGQGFSQQLIGARCHGGCNRPDSFPYVSKCAQWWHPRDS